MKIVRFGDPGLMSETEPVTDIETQVKPYVDDMIATMRTHDGIGLAANQVGLKHSFFILDNSGEIAVYINPEVVFQRGRQKSTEQCLSGGKLTFMVRRPFEMGFEAELLDGSRREITVSGNLARVVAHEIDHLRGFTIAERAQM